jgi:hypothetical protein
MALIPVAMGESIRARDLMILFFQLILVLLPLKTPYHQLVDLRDQQHVLLRINQPVRK